MRKQDVKVGSVYAVKISGAVQPVRIEKQVERGQTLRRERGSTRYRVTTAWQGINVSTGREVLIRSAAKLRCEMLKVNGMWITIDEYNRYSLQGQGQGGAQ